MGHLNLVSRKPASLMEGSSREEDQDKDGTGKAGRLCIDVSYVEMVPQHSLVAPRPSQQTPTPNL